MGAPKSTVCRFCGGGGVLVKGSHIACRNEYMRDLKRAQSGYVPPTACEICGSPDLTERSKRCEACQKKVQTSYKTKWRSRKRAAALRRCRCGCGDTLPAAYKGHYIQGHSPKARPRTRKNFDRPSYKKPQPLRRERPFAEPSKPVFDLPPTNPRGVEPRRIPPVGAAGWSAADARRWG